MSITIRLSTEQIQTLNLSPVDQEISAWMDKGEIATQEQHIQLAIDYELDPNDPRELSEIPEIRLWFVRLDARYPWISFLLDWKNGELTRYAAMLVPHQFSRTEGIQYNPEALELFVMEKVFVLGEWLQKQGIPYQSRLQSMAQLFGYELDEGFFELIR